MAVYKLPESLNVPGRITFGTPDEKYSPEVKDAIAKMALQNRGNMEDPLLAKAYDAITTPIQEPHVTNIGDVVGGFGSAFSPDTQGGFTGGLMNGIGKLVDFLGTSGGRSALAALNNNPYQKSAIADSAQMAHQEEMARQQAALQGEGKRKDTMEQFLTNYLLWKPRLETQTGIADIKAQTDAAAQDNKVKYSREPYIDHKGQIRIGGYNRANNHHERDEVKDAYAPNDFATAIDPTTGLQYILNKHTGKPYNAATDGGYLTQVPVNSQSETLSETAPITPVTAPVIPAPAKTVTPTQTTSIPKQTIQKTAVSTPITPTAAPEKLTQFNPVQKKLVSEMRQKFLSDPAAKEAIGGLNSADQVSAILQNPNSIGDNAALKSLVPRMMKESGRIASQIEERYSGDPQMLVKVQRWLSRNFTGKLDESDRKSFADFVNTIRQVQQQHLDNQIKTFTGSYRAQMPELSEERLAAVLNPYSHQSTGVNSAGGDAALKAKYGLK